MRPPLKKRIRTLWSSTDFSGGLFTNFKMLQRSTIDYQYRGPFVLEIHLSLKLEISSILVTTGSQAMCCLRHFMRIFLYIKSQILGCKERSSKLSSYLRFTTTSARFCHFFFWPQVRSDTNWGSNDRIFGQGRECSLNFARRHIF